MKNKMYYAIILLAIFTLSFGCTKKDKTIELPIQKINVTPASKTLSSGGTLDLIAWGVDTDNQPVYELSPEPTWTADSAIGTLNKETGLKVTFTAATDLTEQKTGAVKATCEDVTGECSITVNASGGGGGDGGGGAAYGIYSETVSGVTLDVDSYMGKYAGGGATFNDGDFVDDTSDYKEGDKSKKATMTVAAAGQYAGWFVQWGLSGSPDTETKDMSAYSGGSLKFWVKTPVDLEIGMRSGNVGAGSETSKVLLSSYGSYTDDSWHEVSIPISDFTGPSPKADLSQIKVLFNVASCAASGGTGGVAKTFRIDNIRWE